MATNNSSKAARSAEIAQQMIDFKARGGVKKVCPPSRRGLPHQAGGKRVSWPDPRSDGDRWGQPKFREFAGLSPDTSVCVSSLATTANDRIGRVVDARSRFRSRNSGAGNNDTGTAAA